MICRVRRARADEAAVVVALWDDARAWLASVGSDQWQYPARVGRIEASIAVGDCWLLDQAGGPVATITVDGWADPEFWSAADEPASALYVHRMVVARSAAGAGLGAALLDWASHRAVGAGKAWLRLDCWRTNEPLRRWYAAQGFSHVRDVVLPHRRSGALFQRRAGAVSGTGPALAG